MIAERYRIERWLGQGGMGSVYRATQLSVQRTVALKRLVDEHLESPSHVERFEREALALSRLSHQSTVRLFDFGRDERGCPFIVMEYLEGSDLAADLEQHGPMRWDQALAVASQILGSLSEAHASGIVHRDIKPANVFLCAAGAWPVVKVLDFGIAGGAEARAGLRKLTLTGTVLGSAPYMSPEQAQGLPAGPAADLYSLGVVLFEMLTGTTPFEARTLTAQLIAKVLEDAPSVRDACPDADVPEEVQALIASLLDREPSRRPPSARATAERIEALLGQAVLPPLSRSLQRPKAAPPIAKTEPMLVPRTVDEGWTPPTGPSPRPRRARRAVGGALFLAAAGAATAWSWRVLPERAPLEPEMALATLGAPRPSSEQRGGPASNVLDAGTSAEPVDAALVPDNPLPRPQPLALLQPPPRIEPDGAAIQPAARAATPVPRSRPRSSPHPRSPAPPRVEPPSRATTVAPPAAAEGPAPPPVAIEPSPSPVPLPSPVTPETLVLPGVVPEPAAPQPAGADGAEAPAASTTPSTDAAEAEPLSTPPQPPGEARSERARGEPIIDPRYWTIAAARAAARRGDITPAERNEIIAALRERRLSARSRAARAYREGRIGYDELLHRQHAIDRRIDGW